MKEKLTDVQNEAQAIFNLIQRLNAPLTEENVAILGNCMSSLKYIGTTLEALKAELPEEAETDEPAAE